jgi:hypothetical protein
MNTSSIRIKLYDYIRIADEKKLHAIYDLLENEIEETEQWWKDKQLVKAFDARYEALESDKDKGFTPVHLEESIAKLRKKKYDR